MRYIVSLRRGILWLTPFNGIRFHRLTCARYRKRIVLHNATRRGLHSPDGEWVTIGGKVKVLNPKKAKPIWTARTDNTGLLTRSGQQGGVRVLGVEKEGISESQTKDPLAAPFGPLNRESLHSTRTHPFTSFFTLPHKGFNNRCWCLPVLDRGLLLNQLWDFRTRNPLLARTRDGTYFLNSNCTSTQASGKGLTFGKSLHTLDGLGFRFDSWDLAFTITKGPILVIANSQSSRPNRLKARNFTQSWGSNEGIGFDSHSPAAFPLTSR
ncbi:hypothetical protein VNO80_06754 [Phaseolus coccineus]|uniref:Uncharacterized protein n=1 Tax=Phaseolus coccineus TaxID=3886 RepID=A0AAN9NHE6_PHACN